MEGKIIHSLSLIVYAVNYWFAFTLLKPQSISELLKKINVQIYLKP